MPGSFDSPRHSIRIGFTRQAIVFKLGGQSRHDQPYTKDGQLWQAGLTKVMGCNTTFTAGINRIGYLDLRCWIGCCLVSKLNLNLFCKFIIAELIGQRRNRQLIKVTVINGQINIDALRRQVCSQPLGTLKIKAVTAVIIGRCSPIGWIKRPVQPFLTVKTH